MKMRYILIIGILLGCLGCSKKSVIENPQLAEVISQVWQNADSAQALLRQIDIQTLSRYDEQRYRLTEAHLMLKRELRLPQQTNLDALALYFEDCGDESSAGEAYYIQGAYLNWRGENTRAMQYLKKAETHATSAIIRGMTYYKMGRISENEQLYDIALDNYHKALPHLEDAGLPLYLASVYREIGRNSPIALSDSFFIQSLAAAEQYGDTNLI